MAAATLRGQIRGGTGDGSAAVVGGRRRRESQAPLSAYITACEAAELRCDGSPRRQRSLNLTTTPAIVVFESGVYKELMQDLWACASRKAVQAERGPRAPRPPVTATEAERQLRGVLERQNAAEAKCEERQYGCGWVTV